METDFYILPFNVSVNLTEEQQNYFLKLEQIFQSNLRDDFALLCNLYKLFKSSATNKRAGVDVLILTKLGSSENKQRLTEVLGRKFGLSEKTIYTYLKIANKFVSFLAGEKFIIDDLKDYSISKLQELLPLSIEQIRNAFAEFDITYKSTKKELREYVKSIKTNNKDNKVYEEKEDVVSDVDVSEENHLVYLYVPSNIMEQCKDYCFKNKLKLEDFILSCVKEKLQV